LQDKAHCPFHHKTAACRFGDRCSRVHFYPDKSCTILIKNMYNGPGLAWEQDEGLEVCSFLCVSYSYSSNNNNNHHHHGFCLVISFSLIANIFMQLLPLIFLLVKGRGGYSVHSFNLYIFLLFFHSNYLRFISAETPHFGLACFNLNILSVVSYLSSLGLRCQILISLP
jgi:hypothetical protein